MSSGSRRTLRQSGAHPALPEHRTRHTESTEQRRLGCHSHRSALGGLEQDLSGNARISAQELEVYACLCRGLP
jgi:hypothetical protein